MKNNCDLHTHSYFSDGSVSPTELVNMAEEIGLSCAKKSDSQDICFLEGMDLTEFLKKNNLKTERTIKL